MAYDETRLHIIRGVALVLPIGHIAAKGMADKMDEALSPKPQVDGSVSTPETAIGSAWEDLIHKAIEDETPRHRAN